MLPDKVKIYSKKDIEQLRTKQTTKQERMYAKMMQPNDITLSDHEEAEYKMLTKAWVILSQFQHYSIALKNIMRVLELSRYQAMVLIKDAQDLLGPILQTNQEFERALVKEKCLKIYDAAMLNDDHKSAALAMNAYIKASGVDKAGESKSIHIPEIPEVVFSNEIEIEDADIIENDEK